MSSQRPPSGREKVRTSPAADATHGDPRRAKSVKALEVRLNARAQRQSTRHSSPACTPVLPCEWRLHSTRPGRASYHTPRAPRVCRTAVTAGVEWRYASSGGSLGLCRSFLIIACATCWSRLGHSAGPWSVWFCQSVESCVTQACNQPFTECSLYWVMEVDREEDVERALN